MLKPFLAASALTVGCISALPALAQDADTTVATVNGEAITLGQMIAMRQGLGADATQGMPDAALWDLEAKQSGVPAWTRAGIAHCTQAQAAELMACVEGARAARHAYSVDVLVPNRRETLEAFPEIPCDRATIDDYLRLMLKGASK